MQSLPISYADVVAAQNRLAGIAHRTPVMTSRTADRLTGASLFFKCENLQRGGAFKFRGGYNALASFSPGQRAKGVVAFSSGNHAQAVALAAGLLAMRAVILMPKDAPAAKVAATRDYGAEVVFYDRYTEDRDAIGERMAAEQGLTLVPPYDHPDVMAGQGTAVKEMLEETGSLDLVLVPMGGGGLLSGSAVAAGALAPGCLVYGVEPEKGDDGRQSLETGSIVHIETPDTIADGAQTRHIGQYTFMVIKELVAGILLVSDHELIRAMRFFAERMKMVVEPTGCLAAAAVFEGRIDVRGKKVGILLSGGNVDLERYAGFLKNEAF